MSFLRGKSTSYTRFTLPDNVSLSVVDKAVQLREFRDIAGDDLEANGFCSYRNLLDASIDRGLVEGHPDLWLTGLRRDVKKAPAALVRAQTARAIADARQVSPNLSKAAQKEIGQKVRFELNLKAQARPAHAAVLINLSTRIGYIDGIASAHEWVQQSLEAGPAIYGDTQLNGQYLAWCAWRAGHGVDTIVSPSGDITFREPKDAGASFDGQHNIDALLDYWIGEQKATVASVALTWAVEFDGETENVDVTLQSAALKVVGMVFPEFIQEMPGTVDEKMSARLGFIDAFERTLAKDYMGFAGLAVDKKLPPEFAALVGL